MDDVAGRLQADARVVLQADAGVAFVDAGVAFVALVCQEVGRVESGIVCHFYFRFLKFWIFEMFSLDDAIRLLLRPLSRIDWVLRPLSPY